MKHPVLLTFLVAIALCVTSPASATNYTNNGTFAAYNLNNGDTLRITQGTFNGIISQLPAGAVIIVAPNATFVPTVLNLWSPAGKIINNGTFQFSGLGIGGNFVLENYGVSTIQGDMSFYNGAFKKMTNYVNGLITINGSLSLGENTTVINHSLINVSGALNLHNGSAIFTNKGYVNVGGALSSHGQLNNENTIKIQGALNYWGGQLNNTGEIIPNGTFSISSGLTYVNQCRLITRGGINNYGTFINNGLVWAGTTNTSADQFTNSGTFISAATAKLRTVNFTNYGTITGSGSFYATGLTTLGSNATVGITGNTQDTIRIYDVSRTSPSRIFDNQWGTVRPNAVYRTFSAPDSMEIPSSCSDIFKTGMVMLPVKWNYFHVTTVRQEPVISWSAEFEQGMQFEIERSYDNAAYEVIRTITANNTADYSFTDAGADMSRTYIAYRIKSISISNNAVKYSEVRIIRNESRQHVTMNVYPNPTVDMAVIEYKAAAAEQLVVRVRTAAGQQLLQKELKTVSGMNKLQLHEVKAFQAGMYMIEVLSNGKLVKTERLVKK
jgi:hypothetical protein